jgi:hypothetical protein
MFKAALRLSFFTLFLSTISCREKNTQDPLEAYKYWSGGDKLPKDVRIIHGKYWGSAHWSKEYIMYLELKAPSKWKDEFIKQNNLVYKKDTAIIPEQDAPLWFKPSPTYKVYVPSGFSEGSVVYNDSVSERMFIYEIQL